MAVFFPIGLIIGKIANRDGVFYHRGQSRCYDSIALLRLHNLYLPVGTKISVKYKEGNGEEKEEEIELMYDLAGKLKEQKKQMEGKIEEQKKQLDVLSKQIKELSEWKEACEKKAREKERCGLSEELLRNDMQLANIIRQRFLSFI